MSLDHMKLTSPMTKIRYYRLMVPANRATENQLKQILNETKGFNLNVTLKITFEKPQGDNTLYKSAYLNSKPQIIVNDIDIDETLGLISQQLRKTKIGRAHV